MAIMSLQKVVVEQLCSSHLRHCLISLHPPEMKKHAASDQRWLAEGLKVAT